ncbi:mCG146551, partial [Mus musculus]
GDTGCGAAHFRERYKTPSLC